ncbi:hypothetical protein EDI_134790 [Entamoeba dispar SAW760]|uniref:Uncharacterized protein n=1 Tax=Entamoeba dispar (strain ATCC PRA-260 / SAW760) TaxID=370354 RepID=B0EJZ2_ENTDS|nr:uncharacterized protein EDI_134790 [Entamoeba dispar SAW760]EDR25158.1 hypothetical protein EDI_134790 [Entamoeba dispar SAW760]|eukprot:EDR25158.1 hypothetical protein EDI_134790 [Entamoeba dispar SAW760]
MEEREPIKETRYHFAVQLYPFAEQIKDKKKKSLSLDIPLNEPKMSGGVCEYSSEEKSIPELYTTKLSKKNISIFQQFEDTFTNEVTKDKTDVFEEIMKYEFGDTLVEHPLDMSSKQTFDIILKFCKKKNDFSPTTQSQLDFSYAKERATNYREIVDTMIMKEIDQQKFTLLDSLASVSDLEQSFDKIKEDMCALSERLKQTQKNVRWLMLGNMKEYQKYQNIRIVIDKMHSINEVISAVNEVQDLVEEKEYKKAIQKIEMALDVIDCKLAGIRCISKCDFYLKQTRSQLEKFLKNPEKFVFELFNRIQLVDEVTYDLKRKTIKEEFKDLMPQLIGLFKTIVGSTKMEGFIEKYLKSIENIRQDICYACLPLEFLKKEEYLTLAMTKQNDIELPLERNNNLKNFIMKLNIKEFSNYFFNILNKFGEMELRAFLVFDVYKEVKKEEKVIESDELMLKINERIEDTIMEYSMLLLSYANLRNIKREEYKEFEERYIKTIDLLQTISNGTFEKLHKIRSTFFQMYFSTLYICGFDEMLKIIKIETFVALNNSTNIIDLITKLSQIINPSDISCRTLKVQDKILRYQGENYMIIGCLDNVAAFTESFLDGFSVNDSTVTDMIFEKSNQVFKTWIDSTKVFYFINVLASEPPTDYVWKCVCIHQSIVFLMKLTELLNIAFMRNEDDLNSLNQYYQNELKNIRNQIIQYFRVIVKKYISSKAEEMEGFHSAKPLPVPPKLSGLSKTDPRKKPLPPSPGNKKNVAPIKINDVIDQLEKNINFYIIKYFNNQYKEEIMKDEENALNSIEKDFSGNLTEENYKTKISSDISFIREEVVKSLMD